MIMAIVERRFQPEKVDDMARLLVELRRRRVKQNGCISSESLRSVSDPSLWVDISTWTYSDQWKQWEATPERNEIQSEIEKLLLASEEVSIFDMVR
jgi:quinol monooxygenase YgiN